MFKKEILVIRNSKWQNREKKKPRDSKKRKRDLRRGRKNKRDLKSIEKKLHSDTRKKKRRHWPTVIMRK